MKNLLTTRKFWIGIAVLALAVVLFLVFRNRKATANMSFTQQGSAAPTDPWAGLRQSLGTWDKKEEDDKMWTAAGHVFLSHIDDADKKNEQIPPYWRAMYAFFKGYNIKPDGYQVIINQPLQDAVKAFVQENPGVTQSSILVGQFIGG